MGKRMTDENAPQSPEELQAFFAEGGPADTANRWLQTVIIEGDLRSAWADTTTSLRRLLVDAWLKANREHPLLVERDLGADLESLSGDSPFSHDLWEPFVATQVREFRETWSDFAERPDDFGTASRPRPVPPDGELIMLLNTHGEALQFSTTTLVSDALCVLLRHEGESWKVDALGADAYDQYIGTAPPDPHSP